MQGVATPCLCWGEIYKIIEDLEENNIFGKDAVHIACAIYSNVDYFITTDYILIKRAFSLKNIKVINPIDFINIEEEIQSEDK